MTGVYFESRQYGENMSKVEESHATGANLALDPPFHTFPYKT